ncbi:hypothetical protein BsWGS_25833 [Bradybaena similaris]
MIIVKIISVLLVARLAASCTGRVSATSPSATTSPPTITPAAGTSPPTTTPAAGTSPPTTTAAAGTSPPTTTADTKASTTESTTESTTKSTKECMKESTTDSKKESTIESATESTTESTSTTPPPTTTPSSITTSPATTTASKCPPQNVVFVMSASSCVGAENIQFIRDFLKETVALLSVSDNAIRVGIVTYGGSAQLVASLTGDKAQFTQGVARVAYLDGTENTADAIRVAQQELTSQGTNGRGKFIFLFMACKSTDAEASVKAAETAKGKGIYISPVGVNMAINETEIAAISSSDSYRLVDNTRLLTSETEYAAEEICPDDD